MISANQAADIAVSARANNVVLPQTRGSQTLAVDSTTTLSFDGRLSSSSFVTLQAGDVIDLTISILNNLPANLDAIINSFSNATLTLKKLD